MPVLSCKDFCRNLEFGATYFIFLRSWSLLFFIFSFSINSQINSNELLRFCLHPVMKSVAVDPSDYIRIIKF